MPSDHHEDSIMFDDRVRIAFRGDGVAQVILARPDKMNAVDMRMFEAVVAAAEHVAKDANIRAVVLSGEGKAFSAGLDLDVSAVLMSDEGQARLIERSHGAANIFQQSALAWRDMAVPVIAALHGPVFGAGLQIALGADIRFAAPDARLSFMELRWGLVPDMGAMVILPGLVRSDVARDLIYSARVLDGDEALSAGLVTRVTSSPLDDALAFATQLARGSQQAVSAAKRMLNRVFAEQLSVSERLMLESSEQCALLASRDNMSALREYILGKSDRGTNGVAADAQPSPKVPM